MLRPEKGRFLYEAFDENGKVIESSNTPFDKWNRPLLVNSGMLRHLEGKLLTISDGTFADEVQRKAQKDLIQNAIWDWWYKYNPGEPLCNSELPTN